MSHLAAVFVHTWSAARTAYASSSTTHLSRCQDASLASLVNMASASPSSGPTNYSGSPIDLYELSLGVESGPRRLDYNPPMENMSSMLPRPLTSKDLLARRCPS